MEDKSRNLLINIYERLQDDTKRHTAIEDLNTITKVYDCSGDDNDK
jgi:hypothetical protein